MPRQGGGELRWRWCRPALLLLSVVGAVNANEAGAALMPAPCDSAIYCQGELLHVVQMARLEKDSKHFVDMSMRYSPADVLLHFEAMMNRTGRQPSREDVKTFVENNFREPSSEFIDWKPSDWKPDPAFLRRIEDRRLRAWVSALHATWRQLGREVTGEVYLHPDRYSLIFVPNPTIVPGGRFREYYYWDSFWVMKGLLLSEMYTTVRGMLENFLVMVDRFGFVPNGGRVYYSRRSQPPFLIPMVKLYLDATGDIDFLRMNMDILEREFRFWSEQRTTNVTLPDGSTLAGLYQYNAAVDLPRPESYREDFTLVETLHGWRESAESGADDSSATYAGGLEQQRQQKQELYANLKSAAESGWDFSTRWFIAPDGGIGSLKDVKTRSLVPVDLNYLLHHNALLLSEFCDALGNGTAAQRYRRRARTMRAAMDRLLWDDTAGAWFDWDLVHQRRRVYFHPSGAFPVWLNASTAAQNERFLQYLTRLGALNFSSGVPTSLEESGQQWDFPNAWPPLQHVLVQALRNIDTDQSRRLALQLVQKWIDTNYLSYVESQPHAMFEKYNVTRMGLPGGGGEYDVQLGFGWTNGVAMALADEYADVLRAPGSGAPRLGGGAPGWPPLLLTLLTALLCSLHSSAHFSI